MAEQKKTGDGVSGGLRIITYAAAALAEIIARPLRAIMRDGTLAAAWRQGLHELGNTFGQMSPDSNSVQEPGTIWNPTQGEIAADRKPYKHFYGSQHSLHTPGMGTGHDRSNDASRSPSEIAKDDRTYRPPGQSNEQGNELEP
jgi:hypothetical protein